MHSVVPIAAVCDATHLHVTLTDGHIVQTPLWWYPKLLNASAEARQKVEFMPMGIHWPEIDEDLGIAGMLRGQKASGAVERSE